MERLIGKVWSVEYLLQSVQSMVPSRNMANYLEDSKGRYWWREFFHIGRCIDLIITEGQVHDSTQAQSLLNEKHPENVIADKGYDSTEIRDQITGMGSNPVIPPRSNRKISIEYNKQHLQGKAFGRDFFQSSSDLRTFAPGMKRVPRITRLWLP